MSSNIINTGILGLDRALDSRQQQFDCTYLH